MKRLDQCNDIELANISVHHKSDISDVPDVSSDVHDIHDIYSDVHDLYSDVHDIKSDVVSDANSTVSDAIRSPFLLGSSVGARFNSMLTHHSLALLVVSGNVKVNENSNLDVGTGKLAILISTNCIHKRHEVTDTYRSKYQRWMDRAVPHLIETIDNMESPILVPSTNNADNLFFDMKLTGLHRNNYLSKLCRIYVVQAENSFFDGMHLFVDTFFHDDGVFENGHSIQNV